MEKFERKILDDKFSIKISKNANANHDKEQKRPEETHKMSPQVTYNVRPQVEQIHHLPLLVIPLVDLVHPIGSPTHEFAHEGQKDVSGPPVLSPKHFRIFHVMLVHTFRPGMFAHVLRVTLILEIESWGIRTSVVIPLAGPFMLGAGPVGPVVAPVGEVSSK